MRNGGVQRAARRGQLERATKRQQTGEAGIESMATIL